MNVGCKGVSKRKETVEEVGERIETMRRRKMSQKDGRPWVDMGEGEK